MLATLGFLSFLAVGAISCAGSIRNNNDKDDGGSSSNVDEPHLEINSTSMALSIIARQQGIMINDTLPAAALQAGIVQKAFAAYIAYHGAHDKIQEYINISTASAAKYMSSTMADIQRWPLDRFSNGNAMLNGHGDGQANELALKALRDSLRVNPRNYLGGLWYWESYPGWCYLDAMYSLGPFAALDSSLGGSSASSTTTTTAAAAATTTFNIPLEDMRLQFRLLWDHCYNDTTGLVVHGYDADRRASWASRPSGASAVAWGRGLGWFMMALVDTMELLPPAPAPAPGGGGGADSPALGTSPGASLIGMYQRLAKSVVEYADKESGGWYQVVDMAHREGNYIESSATAMIAYALLKGARLGYLPPFDASPAREAARAAYALLVRDFVTSEPDGTLGWSGTVAVCSLNSSATYDVSLLSNSCVPEPLSFE